MADDAPQARPSDREGGSEAAPGAPEGPTGAAPAVPDSSGGDLVGADLQRREDAALLKGAARFTDDLRRDGTVHLTFVRSEHGHARVEEVDPDDAAAMDGVLAVYTWADVADAAVPGVLPIGTGGLDAEVPGHPVLARDRVRYHGQPIAAVVAEDPYRARDAAAAVDVEYDPLPAVVDPREARSADAPTVYEAVPDNVATTSELGDREATEAELADADRVVELELENNRLIPSALEPRAALASWDDAEGRLTVELTSQSPHGHRGKLSETLGLPERQIRVIAPKVGGGFGHKGHHHPGEAAAAFASMQLDRPVRWTATRSENYLAGAHGRDHRTTARIGVDEDGTLRGLQVETDAGVGGYGLGGSLRMPGWYGSLLASQYDFPAIHCETRAVFTTTAPIHSYRGAGRPEAVYVAERTVDAAARGLGIDPVELRRRNLIESFPHETPVGAEYDSGDYEPAMEAALERIDYYALRDGPEGDAAGDGPERDAADDGPEGNVAGDGLEGEAADDGPEGNAAGNGPEGNAADDRPEGEAAGVDGTTTGEDGRYRGVGVASYVESTGGGHESGVVRVHPDGTVAVRAGTHSHGQGHATTYAQIVADELGVPYEDVEVAEGDTEGTPTGTGTFGSRSTIAGGNAVAESAREVRVKARRLAAHRLDVDPERVTLSGGTFEVRGDDRSLPFADVAEMAYGWGVPEEMEPGLEATTFYRQEGTAYTFGTHAAVVAVDPETGAVEIERYVAVDDCGERVNPRIVEGQVHGGVAQGIGQARYERAIYDDEGRLRTATMRDYALPRAADLPEFETDHTVTPSPTNELGVKGIGEAGPIAAPPTVVNAVVDALEPLGIDHLDMPLTEERVWRAIDGA